MEYKDVFISIGVVLIGMFGIFGMIAQWNINYSTTAGSSFNETLNKISLINNISDVGNSVGSNTQTAEGSGETDPQGSLIKQSLSTLKKIPAMVGIFNSLLWDSARTMQIPDVITGIALTIFMFIFGLTFAYILLLGAKKI